MQVRGYQRHHAARTGISGGSVAVGVPVMRGPRFRIVQFVAEIEFVLEIENEFVARMQSQRGRLCAVGLQITESNRAVRLAAITDCQVYLEKAIATLQVARFGDRAAGRGAGAGLAGVHRRRLAHQRRHEDETQTKQ